MDTSVKQHLDMKRGMQKGPITKYRPLPSINLIERQWPSQTLATPPRWCSVDLRDGNQALPIPMSGAEKLEMFKLLVGIGFKEIEVGFPSASQIEFDFIRCLIEEKHIPDDVTIQVLTQAREELISRTVESVHGAKQVILHLYNSTSSQQRRLVFKLEKPDIVGITTRATRLLKELALTLPETQVTFEYTPESFVLTEVDFALEVCEAVVDVWQPTREQKIILNLPETVQVASPNIYADQIEWICRHLRQRETSIISLHTHNDRGTGVASAELGLLAGGERIEGTLFGNGERTGNTDIVTLALNMYMQGVDPGLNFSDLNDIRVVYERCTHMQVPIRQPYAGELVFTAFSGSHQDAIRKGMAAQNSSPDALWDVPYLPIDPRDIGRTYEAIIRINAQSGKGGVAYVLEHAFGLQLPKEMHAEFGRVIQTLADTHGNELSPTQLFQAFEQEYVHHIGPYQLAHIALERLQGIQEPEMLSCVAHVQIDGVVRKVQGQGNNPVLAFANALIQGDLASFTVESYTAHARNQGLETQEVVYVHIRTETDTSFFGVAIETDVAVAAAQALVSALNRADSH